MEDTGGYVYIVEADVSQINEGLFIFKIGKTSAGRHPGSFWMHDFDCYKSRMSSIQTGNPFKIKQVAAIKRKKFITRTEKQAHIAINGLKCVSNMNGEWFISTIESKANILRLLRHKFCKEDNCTWFDGSFITERITTPKEIKLTPWQIREQWKDVV